AVCFKDASGTSVPSTVHETIRRARKMLPPDAFIHFHTHETAGTSVLTYKAAIDAGVDAIDLSLAPCSGGTCQPDLLVMWHALRGSEYTLDIDIEKVREAEEVFKECMADYFLPPEAVAVEPLIPWSPMPGGALTANTQMMRDNGIMDKYPDLIKAMSDVVRRGGFGTSVTPVSQFYVQQALNNVMFGPWKKIAEPYGKMVLGYFGKTPVPPDPEIVKTASEQLGLEPTTRAPLEINDEDPNKGVEPARKALQAEGLEETDENVFIAAACKEKGIDFLKGEAKVGVRLLEKSADEPATESSETGKYVVSVNGRDYRLAIDGNQATVNGVAYQVGLKPDEAGDGPAAPPTGKTSPVTAEMPGVVLRLLVAPGDPIQKGDALLVLEAMKMEVHINAPSAGIVAEMSVSIGDQVTTGQVLATIG
ncbi:MAG: biotin/lipoyl-containing protein, partial [Pirellulaceae bacterium]|nr:biotin/lipoyl-containing protein [Pirellulaceae bacterium]